ncbi:putative membrane protein [Stella humosa]|uniref:Putative membrane protein n=1 Tax=Stella humosa TaxID=94 RepID=A0A3N1MLI7_9PROT|nr:DUF599 domain-containing protein [Stella humosa]ROQ01856.1 putative membrane protein [Stella humosa]BBK32245.1 hypothetical protein STHU_28790 [Stella humosa]
MNISILDGVAFATFIVAWCGYTFVADHSRWGQGNLITTVHTLRRRWMEEAVRRDNRIGDTNLLGNLMRSVTFFTSTTIFILGGLLAVLGAADRARDILLDLPFAAHTSKVFWELKIMLLLVSFTYAFFKLTWSVRQFNYCCIVLGATPPADGDPAELTAAADQAARLANLAGDNFNAGLRAYYFALAALCWFVHPGLFMAASIWVVLVLYRREFRSHTRRVLLGED